MPYKQDSLMYSHNMQSFDTCLSSRYPTQDNTSFSHTASRPWRVFLSGTLAAISVLFLGACGDNTPNPSLIQSAGDFAHSQSDNTHALSGEFAGAGASSQKSAVDAWIVGYTQSQSDVRISYDPSGSGAGVNTFLTGAVLWAGTDAPLTNAQLEASRAVCYGETAFEIPAYVSPIALAYNLSDYGITGNQLRLAPQTIAKIFTGKITWWDDREIRHENPEISELLPHLEITPIWRSDKSGTTKTFQTYLHQSAPQQWPMKPTETWPNTIGQGAKGTPSVVMTISQAQGTIGYADFAQTAGLGTVSVKVGENYVAPNPQATERLIENSPLRQDNGKNRFVVDVDYATQLSGAYPIALVSYDVACPVYKSEQTAQFIRQWLGYVESDPGQKIAQDNAGSAPIPAQLRKNIRTVISQIHSHDDAAIRDSSNASLESPQKDKSPQASQSSYSSEGAKQ